MVANCAAPGFSWEREAAHAAAVTPVAAIAAVTGQTGPSIIWLGMCIGEELSVNNEAVSIAFCFVNNQSYNVEKQFD